jgi:adenylosuccinate lyase
MIERYADPEITRIWSNENKVKLWEETELAVIRAMAALKQLEEKDCLEIVTALEAHPIDIQWWLEKEKEMRHDLNAFVAERTRFLPSHLQQYFHQKITSYDTEEPAFVMMLIQSLDIVRSYSAKLIDLLAEMAKKYRFTVMNGRTHGQEAELQTFGKRTLTWLQDLALDMSNLAQAKERLQYSKLSGAVGNYTGISPELEAEALKILGFKPYYGATQIMPREIYAPTAQALCQIVLTLDKIATSIRLGARSGRPIFQEPFSKKQTGSSTMPHKKNTISTEQIEGMARTAQGYLSMIMANIKTWEERAIEQSCVERIAWPDLFHVVVHSLKTMTRVLSGLVVYPDNMLLEIIESRGCYASSTAKEVLKKLGEPHGLTVEECYRIIQLAAFNAFEPSREIEGIRNNLPESLEEADRIFVKFLQIKAQGPISIRDIIAEGKLRTSAQLSATEEDVKRWNETLKKIFESETIKTCWYQIFLPSNLLQNEQTLYQKILNVES